MFSEDVETERAMIDKSILSAQSHSSRTNRICLIVCQALKLFQMHTLSINPAITYSCFVFNVKGTNINIGIVFWQALTF